MAYTSHVNKVDISDEIIDLFNLNQSQWFKLEEVIDFIWDNVIETQNQSKYILCRNVKNELDKLLRNTIIEYKQIKLKGFYKFIK